MIVARRALLAAGIASLVALGWVAYSWGRDCSLVKVRHVQVSGLTTAQAPAIRRALTEAAEEMTTLHVDRAALTSRVERYPIVRSVSTSADFPNTLRITVHEYRPSAVVTDPSGRRVAVAEDGTLLPHMSKDKLAAVKVKDISDSGKVTDQRSLGVVELLGQAPPALRAKIGSAYWGKAGIRVALREGPSIEFGSPDAAAGKWLAAARVLADDSSQGAKLIDVRLPGRPVAGGFAAGSEGTAGSVPAAEQSGDPTATAAPGTVPQPAPGTVPGAAPAPAPDPQL
jgi:cell division protein FtsQ